MSFSTITSINVHFTVFYATFIDILSNSLFWNIAEAEFISKLPWNYSHPAARVYDVINPRPANSATIGTLESFVYAIYFHTYRCRQYMSISISGFYLIAGEHDVVFLASKDMVILTDTGGGSEK